MRVRIYRSDLTNRSRALRRNQTEAEKILWFHLRNKNLQGIKFQRQFAIDVYVVDFVARKYNLVIELDGGQHNEESNKKYDETRTKFLEKQGYKVIRFWDNDLFENISGVLETILQAVKLSS